MYTCKRLKVIEYVIFNCVELFRRLEGVGSTCSLVLYRLLKIYLSDEDSNIFVAYFE